MTPEERKVFEDVPSPHLKYWIPVVWFSNLASKARQDGRIQENIDLQNILNVTFWFHCNNINVETEPWPNSQLNTFMSKEKYVFKC